VTSVLSVALHELGTRNTLLGRRPNNTIIYLTSVISTQNHTIAREKGTFTYEIFITLSTIY